MNDITSARILLVDNDEDYLHSTVLLLRLKGYQVSEATSVAEGIEKLSEIPHLVLVDLRLTNDDDAHDMSGLEVAYRAKDYQVPCIIVTGYPSTEMARVSLRSVGAEALALDFVSKKHGPQPLLDTIAAVLSERNAEQVRHTLVVDPDKRMAYLRGKQLKLSQYQYALLEYLYLQEGGTCTPAELVRAVYGESVSEAEARTDRRLEGLVDRLREKIESDPSDPQFLVTMPWQGYRLQTDP